MLFRYAVKLHGGDEIELKSTGEVGKVLSTYVDKTNKVVRIEAIFPASGYIPMDNLTHRDIL